MEQYLETILKVNVEKNYIDTQAIARDNNKINLIRLVSFSL